MGKPGDSVDHDELWTRAAVVAAVLAGALALAEIAYLLARLFVG